VTWLQFCEAVCSIACACLPPASIGTPASISGYATTTTTTIIFDQLHGQLIRFGTQRMRGLSPTYATPGIASNKGHWVVPHCIHYFSSVLSNWQTRAFILDLENLCKLWQRRIRPLECKLRDAATTPRLRAQEKPSQTERQAEGGESAFSFCLKSS